MKTILFAMALALAGCKHKQREVAPPPRPAGEPPLEFIPPQNLPIPMRPAVSRKFELGVDAPVSDPRKARVTATLVAEF